MDETKVTNKECRMYENKYPEVDDLIIVKVKNIAEMGAYVELLEYNNIEGMILLSELSRRRIRSINRLIRVGRKEIVVVLRVDEEKGYIDLSKRRVLREDVQQAEQKFNKSKTVHSILRHVSETSNIDLQTLYEEFGWDLYKRYGHAWDAFQLIVRAKDPQTILGQYDIRKDVFDALMKSIRKRLQPQAVKVRADLEVTCFKEAGINAIKEALKAGEACSTEECKIKIKLVAPPLYVMMTTSLDKEAGIKLLEHATSVIKKTIKQQGGTVVIQVKARAVSERDDKLLDKLMESLEKQNQEIDGDDNL